MTCLEIISKLFVYQLQLINVLDLSDQQELVIDVSSEYSYITIDIKKSGEQFVQIQFELREEAGKVLNVYCPDSTTNTLVLSKIKQETWAGWSSPAVSNPAYSDHILQSLQTADSIAALTTNCARGDNYRPGNFSKISVNSERIELRQINHMNAKSLDHKNDYSLRDLVFNIPFEPKNVKKKTFNTYQAGTMTIEFSDNSSENNKPCGQKVIDALNALD